MKNFSVNLKICTTAVCEENVQDWLDNFVIPDLIERWSNGNMKVETNIEEV